jgi:hypothetical protein
MSEQQQSSAIPIESWRQHYNTIGRSSLGCVLPAPEAILPRAASCSTPHAGQPISAATTAGTQIYPGDLLSGAGHKRVTRPGSGVTARGREAVSQPMR